MANPHPGSPLSPEEISRPTPQAGMSGLVNDWAAERRVFDMPWGKTMMWLFILSDVFIFACFLVGYMVLRISTVEPWPDASEVFALTVAGQSIPLLLIAIMTFILIGEGVRPWENPWGAAQFGAVFFLITGFHGTHVTIGVIFIVIMAVKVMRGSLEGSRPPRSRCGSSRTRGAGGSGTGVRSAVFRRRLRSPTGRPARNRSWRCSPTSVPPLPSASCSRPVSATRSRRCCS